MSKIEIGRFSEQLRKMLGQKGQEIVAGDLSPEVSPTIELEGDAAEWRFLKSVRDVASAANLVEVAANFGRFRLRNPLGSAVIAQVNLVNLIGHASISIVAARGTETTDLALGTVASTVLDQRWEPGGNQQAGALIFSVTNLDAVEPVGRVFVRTARSSRVVWELTRQIVLPPGANLDWGSVTVNVRAQAYVFWHERQLPRLEE